MNNLTLHFHQTEFPGFEPSRPWHLVADDLWQSSDLPFVDTGIDIDVAFSYQWALDHPGHFDKDSRTEYFETQSAADGTAWFKATPAVGWYCCNIFGSNKGSDPHADDTLTKFWPDAFPDLVDKISALGLPVARLAVFKLDPGSYVQPHIDSRYGRTGGLNHVWLPLHDFSPSLKIYPHGYVNHRAGRIYLLNNPRYVHSVINQQTIPRYIAAMTLNYHNMDSYLEDRILRAAKNQWFGPDYHRNALNR